MNTIKLVQRIHRKYAGDTKYPAQGDTKWNLYLDHANDGKDDWATDPDNKWRSTLEPEEREIGTVTNDRVYPLDDEVADVADYVYIDALSGQRYTYPVIKPEERGSKSHSVFTSSHDPAVITFTDAMPAELIGGTIRALCHVVPDDMKAGGDTVAVDRPAWLVLYVVSELARNDPAKDDQFPDLNGQMNDEWAKMVSANNSLPANQADEISVEGFNNYGEDC